MSLNCSGFTLGLGVSAVSLVFPRYVGRVCGAQGAIRLCSVLVVGGVSGEVWVLGGDLREARGAAHAGEEGGDWVRVSWGGGKGGVFAGT